MISQALNVSTGFWSNCYRHFCFLFWKTRYARDCNFRESKIVETCTVPYLTGIVCYHFFCWHSVFGCIADMLFRWRFTSLKVSVCNKWFVSGYFLGRPAVRCIGQPESCPQLGILWRLRSVRRRHVARQPTLSGERLGFLRFLCPWGQRTPSPWHFCLPGLVQQWLEHLWAVLLLILNEDLSFR